MKIGLIFGSFNPPHIGHLMLAKAGLRLMDKVIFIPAFQNPFKEKSAPFEDRVNMLKELLNDYEYLNGKVEISEIEKEIHEQEGTTYTYQVLDKIYNDNNNDYYIVLTDETLNEIPTWKCGALIAKTSKFFVIHFYGQRFNKNCTVETWIDGINIHSTNIRDFIKNRACPYPYITKSVYEYIKERKFYE